MRQIFISLLLLTSLLICGQVLPVQAQSYELLLKGGHVIDPKNGIDGPMDIAVNDGVVARVASDIPTAGNPLF